MKLDILFIHPNAAFRVYQNLSKDFSAIEPPIWAAMLAKKAKLDGFSVDILDCEAERLTIDEAEKRVRDYNATLNVIVIYGQQPSASTQNMYGAELLAKKLGNEKYVLFVGAHPSALPTRTAKDNPGLFVCKGEGPGTIQPLIQILKNRPASFTAYINLLKQVPGLYYYDVDYKGYEIAFIKNESAPLIQDLDNNLPGMLWENLDISRYRTSNWHSFTNKLAKQPFASIYTSLGCPFACTFCMINTPFGGSSFRFWSPEFTVNQLEYLANQGIRNIKFADEMFVLRKDHFLKICELIIERKLDLNIWAYARVDTVKEYYLERLKKAGVNWLALGIESANRNVRLEVTKGKFEDVNISNIVSKIRSFDINIVANYIFGLPTDTQDTMDETLDLALDLNTEWANFYSAMAYPGSQLHREMSEKKPLLLPESANGPGWLGYSQHAKEIFNLSTDNLTREEILKFRDDAFNKYFFREEYFNMLNGKFGPKAVENIKEMLSINLERHTINTK